MWLLKNVNKGKYYNKKIKKVKSYVTHKIDKCNKKCYTFIKGLEEPVINVKGIIKMRKTVQMDLVPLTDEQLIEVIKGQEIKEVDEKSNNVVAKSNGKKIVLDKDYDLEDVEGVYYQSHNRTETLFANITDWTVDEKKYLTTIINSKLDMRNKRLVENDVVLPLQLSGRIKPKHLS